MQPTEIGSYVFFRGLITYGVCLAGFLVAIPAMAEPLTDPTRPPGEEEASAGTGSDGPVLQSVLLGPGRKVAVISGQPVALGQKFGDQVLVRISEHAVVLQDAQGVRTSLTLHPAVTKTVRVKKPEKKIAAKKTKPSGN